SLSGSGGTVNAENSNRPIGEEVSRMQQSAYRTSSNGQYEPEVSPFSPDFIGKSLARPLS
ncbi:hypothetical protein, partial [Thiolapillus sp.]|uniref:hypothetical protein n=1 Tax=Thiolapillus sp. TaxID=2017437 RepID=UPI003AF54056